MLRCLMSAMWVENTDIYLGQCNNNFTQLQHLCHAEHEDHSDGLQPASDPVHGDPLLPAAPAAVARVQFGAGQ